MIMGNYERAAANKQLPKAVLNGLDWTVLQGSTLKILLNFRLQSSAFGNTQNFRSLKN